ncbi:hypothetical protein [Pontivivens ytuae]|uniref:Lipoprotein n=1 Tax=Pontivivens ytuae TaxID=2789856 RepID=A0A7S9LRS4_9RHOB|nr:hypothetical protein [Pontivivens ytuae]QPH53899.1 hypothetical protein I0K15_19340 [Pontivivens ytuae]
MLRALPFLGLVLLTACGPRIAFSNENAVVISYRPGTVTLDEVRVRAAAACAEFGKGLGRPSFDRQMAENEREVGFLCV